MEYKGYQIVSDGTYSMRHIKAIGKGSVHLSLRGNYTSVEFAKQAIDAFVAEEKEDGKTTKSNRG